MPRPRAYELSREDGLSGIVFECLAYDHGVAREAARESGTEHLSVTFDPDGGYPAFPCPVDQLKELPGGPA